MVKKPKLSIAPAVTDDDGPDDGREMMRRKEFLELVVEKSGAKKGDARGVTDAVLAAMAEVLAAGKDMNLPPLGKVKMVKEKQVGARQVLTVRVIIGGGSADSAEGLAEDDGDV
jgi:DNA-binding protein HU-alpha